MQQHEARRHGRPKETGGLDVVVATTPAEREACYRLRYRVFVEEMGASIPPGHGGLERDRFDSHCHHMLVRDRATGAVVACTRVLTDTQARLTGGFYSEQEFDLAAIRRLSGRVMEIGRTCVDPAWRRGGTIAALWAGLARFMADNRFGFLIGCASIPMDDGGVAARAITEALRQRHLAPVERRVRPRCPLPAVPDDGNAGSGALPPLLKAYMRLGARIGGEPCWDPDFGCADLFILLESGDLQSRYLRHFVERRREAEPRRAHIAA
ncbi:GNAT family N-acetyltransferase [Guyparkeria hydrothermalis]|uniref:GNAT family N-acetyltransferase n=1 Tax=Guyparkeria hydrothermalis TaxID=923 RepID=UPI0020218EBE|nr:GNAT family N-acyltransferase [Guyparkeria hydrothermalis]MCL7743547.1 GNAT family N-acetyltransferase [Guyparkeria hydrothermalis]